jgi:predicted RNA-binding protein with RPS1 domain
MRLINKNSRRGVVNLFADFILSKINNSHKSIIQVTDCGAFMVVNGLTTSEDLLDILKLKEEFVESFSDTLKSLEITDINIIDVIRYKQEINSINKGWVMINKNHFKEESEPINEISISSEFPYGYSLDCGRLMTYYSHYIINHMFNLLMVDDVSFYFTTEQNDDEDYKIKVISNSKVDKKSIKSLILDVFDFDLTTFKSRLDSYNLMDDILDPDGEKPYLQQDMLEHVILF